MANRRAHLLVGSTSSMAAAAYLARDQGLADMLPEVIGSGLGGLLGALAPDIIEPASHPGHRSVIHSYGAAAAGLMSIPHALLSWQEHCRDEARQHDRRQEESADGWSRLWHAMAAFLWRMLSGFLVGVTVGFASHLFLDALTPWGLPLVA